MTRCRKCISLQRLEVVLQQNFAERHDSEPNKQAQTLASRKRNKRVVRIFQRFKQRSCAMNVDHVVLIKFVETLVLHQNFGDESVTSWSKAAEFGFLRAKIVVGPVLQ
jgi:hypothetical protein